MSRRRRRSGGLGAIPGSRWEGIEPGLRFFRKLACDWGKTIHRAANCPEGLSRNLEG